MSKFQKANFEYHGGYLHYNHNGERKFVARFKYHGPVNKAKFVAVLKKHYSVDEYFAKLADHAPLQIFKDDGHLSFHYGENGARNYFVLDGKVI